MSKSPNLSQQHTNLSSFASLSNIMNLYKFYSLGGPAAASLYPLTLAGDELIKVKFETERSYVSLSAFWSYIGYKSIEQITSSERIPAQYKIPLQLLAGLVSVGMVTLGPDIFGKKHDLNTTFKKVGLISSFFDKDGSIARVEKGFQIGYYEGLKKTLENFSSLISNKFLISCLLRQATEITHLVIASKFFSGIPSKELAMMMENESGIARNITKYALLSFLSNITSLIKNTITSKLDSEVKHHVDVELANLALQPDNTHTVIMLGDDLKSFARNVSSIQCAATSSLSSIMSDALTPLIPSNSISSGASPLESFKLYPVLFTMNSLFEVIFNYSNLTKAKAFIRKKIYKQSDDILAEGEEMQEIASFPGARITTRVTTESYTYENIQEIAKVGANIYMLHKLLKYIDHVKSKNSTNKSADEVVFDFLKDLVERFAFAGQYKLYDLSLESMHLVQQDIKQLTGLLGINGDGTIDPLGNPHGSFDVTDKVRSVILALKVKIPSIVVREINDKMVLAIKEYSLKMKSSTGEEDKLMLYIPELEFRPGTVNAIIGKTGLGKTTLLSDIAECLMPSFISSGKILYPSLDGTKLPQIFCGTKLFSPPDTSLFEKLTYRLPVEYVEIHNADLLTQLKILCAEFEFHLSDEKLHKKGQLSLSTGQEKIVTIISAILYKRSLEQPVLFVIDETLANLDLDVTTPAICSAILREFSDSIIIAVDHQAKHNTGFYQNLISLQDFAPIPLMMDDVSSDGVVLSGLDAGLLVEA